jgi:hypothetical protein
MEKFTLTRDMADYLKTEISVATPLEQRDVINIAEGTNELLIALFGDFIPRNKIKQNRDIKNRIVVCDNKAFHQFPHLYNSITEPVNPKTRGFAFENGNLALVRRHNVWDAWDIEWQDEMISIIGNIKAARRYADWCGTTRFIIHEIAHLYQDWNVPQEFLELGANFLENAISKLVPTAAIISDEGTENNTAFFNKLVELHGTDVYRLYFGKPLHDGNRARILSDTSNFYEN